MMRRNWILVGVIGLSLAGLGCASGQTAPAADTAAPSLAEARTQAGKGRLDTALAELDLLAKVVPEEAGVERLRGVILYQKEMLPEAEAAFGKAVAQDAADRESLAMRGVTLYRLGRPAEAIPLLEKARELRARDSVAHRSDSTEPGNDGPDSSENTGGRLNVEPSYVLGLCYTDARRYDDARRAFADQFGFGADTAEAYLVAARLFLRREFAEEAGVFGRKALELNPRLPLAHQLLGEVALARADLPLAVKELEAERGLNPLNGALYDRLGDAYVRNGQYAEARVALNKAVLLEPNTTGPYILLGEALVKLGEPMQAVHYLTRAVAMDPGNFVAHTMLGQAYRALGRSADATREYKMAAALQHKGEGQPGGQK